MVQRAGYWKKIDYFKTLKISTFSCKLWKKWNISRKLYSFLVWYLCSLEIKEVGKCKNFPNEKKNVANLSHDLNSLCIVSFGRKFLLLIICQVLSQISLTEGEVFSTMVSTASRLIRIRREIKYFIARCTIVRQEIKWYFISRSLIARRSVMISRNNERPFIFSITLLTVVLYVGEREIKYHFISRRTIARRAIKLLYFPAIPKKQNK